MPSIDLSILNQRQTPAFYADTLANRPAAGFVGRIFVSTNTYAFYRDNGTSWDLIGGPGTGTVTGSGANGQVTFWDGASSISGSNNLFWDNVNGHLGIKTITPTSALDVNHSGTLIASFNNTSSVNSLVGFKNAGNEQWWIGTENTNDDFLFYDATNFPTLTLRTTFKTSGQVLIGGGSTGSGKLVVESATSDNGIQIVGANAPSLRIDNANTGATLRIGLGISTGTNNFIQGSASGNMCVFNGSTTASPMLFGIYDTTNVQEAARISAARNFLIGTTTDAGQKLQVNGTSKITASDSQLTLSHSGGVYSTTLVTNSIGNFYIQPNGSFNALTIASTGAATFSNTLTAVGTISYTGTSKAFEAINGTTGYVYQYYGNTGATFYLGVERSTGGGLFTGSSNYATTFGSNNATDLQFGTNGIIRTTISSSGNLLIGTTTDAGQKLQVNGTASFTSTGLINITSNYNFYKILEINNTNNTSGNGTIQSLLGTNCNDTNSYHFVANTGTIDKFYIYGNGTYTTVSDQRLKKNINKVTDNYLDKVLSLNIVNYNWIDQLNESPAEFGMIAQEVEKIIPNIVHEGRANIDGIKYKGIQSSVLPYILIKAIQELNTKIENLK